MTDAATGPRNAGSFLGGRLEVAAPILFKNTGPHLLICTNEEQEHEIFIHIFS